MECSCKNAGLRKLIDIRPSRQETCCKTFAFGGAPIGTLTYACFEKRLSKMLQHLFQRLLGSALVAGCLCLPHSALASEYHNCAQVENAHGEIDGDTRPCGACRANGFNDTGCVKCNWVSLSIPAGETIITTSRSVDPNPGWARWLDGISQYRSGNTWTVKTGLANWSNNLSRTICLFVTTK